MIMDKKRILDNSRLPLERLLHVMNILQITCVTNTLILFYFVSLLKIIFHDVLFV